MEEVTEEAPGNLFRFVTSLVAKVLSSRPARPGPARPGPARPGGVRLSRVPPRRLTEARRRS